MSTLVALLEDNSLLTFDSSLAGSTRTRITGTLQGESLQSIAIKPSTGQLYAISLRHLYTVDLTTGAAQLIGSPSTSLGLDGTRAVMSFDPLAGDLRVVSDGLQNLLIAPVTGQVVDNESAPHYATGDIHFGKSPSLTFLAYSNQLPRADSTTLFAGDDFGGQQDNLVTLGGPGGVPPPSGGEMFSVGPIENFRALAIGGPNNDAFGLVEGTGLELWSMNLADGKGSLLRVVATVIAGVNGLAVLPSGQTALPALSIHDAAVNESQAGPSNAVFTVSLSAPATQQVTVHYATGADTAQTPEDYQSEMGTLTFAPGETIKTVMVPVNVDTASAADETFFVTLSNPVNASLARPQAVGTIRADTRTLVLGGIYIEDFSDDQDPSKPAFDSTGTFQHCFTKGGLSHCVNDPTEISRPDLGYSVGTQIPGESGVILPNPALVLNGSGDRILFPNLAPGVHVDFASVDVSHVAAGVTVTFVGSNGVFAESFTKGDPDQTVSVGIKHTLPSGQVLGRITEIDLTGGLAAFDNVKILVVPDQPPIAADAFADTPPGVAVTVNVLDSAHSQDGSPVHLVGFTQPGVTGARVDNVGDLITYHPASGYDGKDEFTYTVADPLGNTATAAVHILVRIPPVLRNGSYTIDPSAASLSITDPHGGLDRFLGFTDEAGPKPTFLLGTPPLYGTLDLHADGTFTYTPTKFNLQSLYGISKPIFVSDTFTYVANDGLDSNTATVTITQGPLAIARSQAFTVSSQHSYSHVDFATDGGISVLGVNLTVPDVLHPSNAANSIHSEGVLTHDTVLTADAGLILGDGRRAFVQQITVTQLPRHGTLWSDNGELTTGGEFSRFNGGISDQIGYPAHGTFNLDGSFYYVPDDDFVGVDQFTYKFTYSFEVNGQVYSSDSNQATVALEVPATDPPITAQGHLVSLPSLVNGALGPTVTFRSPGESGGGEGTRLLQVQAVPNPSPSDAPAAEFPFGFFHFEVTGFGPNQTETTVALVLSSPLPGDPASWTYWRFGPTPRNNIPHWYQFLYRHNTDSDSSFLTGAEFLDSTHILLHFFDGDRGDDDLSENGVIVDSGGPAVSAGFAQPEARFVAAVYQKLLDRLPEPAGANFWAGLLEKGTSRLQIVQAIYDSPEHRGIQVDQFYSTYLHRAADPAGRTTWMNALLAGATETDVAVAFLLSPEYSAAHADATAFVKGLYADILGRSPDPGGLSVARQFLEQSAAFFPPSFARALAARAVLTSPEAYTKTIEHYYQDYLPRPSDPLGRDTLLALLENQRTTLAITAEALLASDEFFTRPRTSSN